MSTNRTLFHTPSFSFTVGTPCWLLGLSRCWAVRLPDSGRRNHQIMNERLPSWSHDMSLLMELLANQVKIYCHNYGFIFRHIRWQRTTCYPIYFSRLTCILLTRFRDMAEKSLKDKDRAGKFLSPQLKHKPYFKTE